MIRTAIVSTFAAVAFAQGPGNGVSKSTYSATNTDIGLSFMLEHFPTTAAEDSCVGNVCSAYSSPDGAKTQGRGQLVTYGYLAGRTCKLLSAYSASAYSASTGSTNMIAPASAGVDCTYYSGYAFDDAETTVLFEAFAHTADQCCKACAATEGCVASVYATSATADDSTTVADKRRLQGPQYYEGYGLHLVNVESSSTEGGLDVATLETHFSNRVGTMEAFDAFLDYSITLFTANLPAYAASLSKAGVPTLSAKWTTTNTSETWYSLFVHVPKSQMVLELVGKSLGDFAASTTTEIEARVSPRNVAKYSVYEQDPLNLLYHVSANRATSSIDTIADFYTNIIKATEVHSVTAGGSTRKCYAWGTAESDVCFTERAESELFDPNAYDENFSVKDFETMIWSVHAKNILSPSSSDKYNDNHYAVDLHGYSGDYLSTYFTTNYDSIYPITANSTFAFDCDQDYVIDPTGWSIQMDISFTSAYPSCTPGF